MVALAAYALPLPMFATNKRGFSSVKMPVEANQSWAIWRVGTQLVQPSERSEKLVRWSAAMASVSV
jgi:hypothetical protein